MERSKLIRPSASPWYSPILPIKKKDGDYSTTKSLARSLSTLSIANENLLNLPLSSLALTIKPNPLELPHDRKHRQETYDRLNQLIFGIRQQKLKVLNNHRFPLILIKCSIIKNKIDYLGHSIDEYGITPLYDNIKAIRELKLPDYPTLKQANEFIGGIVGALHRVTNLAKNKRHKFIWGDEQQQAVQQLKMITTGPELVLEFPDPDLPFTLSTDASQLGLGAILKE
ncbi:unnamed protein product [Rotaria magnacalcarata]